MRQAGRMRSAFSRISRFIGLLPETWANCLRFRVFFILPRWFKTPSRITVAGETVRLSFPEEDGVDSDFITCVLRNEYGLSRGLGRVDTVIDVGANLGFFSLAARGHYPRAVIHAYEPNPRILSYLRSNLSGCGVEVFPEAVGSRNCRVRMIDPGPSNQARAQILEDGTEGVQQIGLETAIRRIGDPVDLLKLDCEGAEWEILGLTDCWKSVRNVRLEFHRLLPGQGPELAVEMLTGRGFRIRFLQWSNEKQGILWASR